jgi:hypothetical protein
LVHVILVHKPGYNLELQALKAACKCKTKKKRPHRMAHDPTRLNTLPVGGLILVIFSNARAPPSRSFIMTSAAAGKTLS